MKAARPSDFAHTRQLPCRPCLETRWPPCPESPRMTPTAPPGRLKARCPRPSYRALCRSRLVPRATARAAALQRHRPPASTSRCRSLRSSSETRRESPSTFRAWGESPAPAFCRTGWRMSRSWRPELLDQLRQVGAPFGRVSACRGEGAAAQDVRDPPSLALPHAHALAATCAGFRDGARPRAGVLLKLLSPRAATSDPAYLLQVGGALYGGALRLERDLLQLHANAVRRPKPAPATCTSCWRLLGAGTSWHRLHRVAGAGPWC